MLRHSTGRLHPLEATCAALETTLLRGAESNAAEAQAVGVELVALEEGMREEMHKLEECSKGLTATARGLEEVFCFPTLRPSVGFSFVLTQMTIAGGDRKSA